MRVGRHETNALFPGRNGWQDALELLSGAEWVIANNGVAPFRGDRMPIKKFKGKLFKVRVATVLLDAQQEKRPPATQYSKVSAILELLTTNESSN